VRFTGRTLGGRSPFARLALAVFRGELRGLLRDRRALVSAILLPALLYPLALQGRAWMQRVSRETIASRTVHVGLDLAGAPVELANELRRALGEEQPIQLDDVDASGLRELARALLEGRPEAVAVEQRVVREMFALGAQLVLTSDAHPAVPGRVILRVHYDGSDEASNEALVRVERALARVEDAQRAERIKSALGEDPARGLGLEAVDVASPEEASGALLGRLLPILAVLVLVSGGAYAALSAFAGERENGTLETLLVQPAPPLAIAWGKFGAVLLLSFVALATNLGSMLASLAAGIGDLGGATTHEGLAIGAGRLVLGALLFLPSGVFLCALLVLASARAASFREGQHLLLPLSLLALVPAGFAGQMEAPLDYLLAQVPILGPSLALRDALAGNLAWGPALAMLGASMAWSALVLHRLAHTLDAERVLSTPDDEQELAQRRLQSRTALRWGAASALLVYVVGGVLQSWRPLEGILITSWVLLPILALASARGTARRAKEPLARTLGLVRPQFAHVAAALLCAPALAQLMRVVVALQKHVLPLPSRVIEAGESFGFLRELSPLAAFAALALTPGITEELLFRGAILSGLKRDLRPHVCVLWQALLFGAAHASIYRFLPSGIVGAALTLVVLRAKSVWPAILLHVAYDGVLVLQALFPWLGDPRLAFLALPGMALFFLRRGVEAPAAH